MTAVALRTALALLSSLDPEEAARHSVLNYHAVGLDYLCLLRSPRLTVKVYLANPGKVEGCGNRRYLVNPHSHAYSFDTTVLRGNVANIDFHVGQGGEPYNRYAYDTTSRTILLREDVRLRAERRLYTAGESYALHHAQVHTIELHAEDTVLLLFQYEDVTTETSLFALAASPPVFDPRLYRKPSAGDVGRMMVTTAAALAEVMP